jgi:hypothetical protein
MKINLLLLILLHTGLFLHTGYAQKSTPAETAGRVPFVLKNTLGYHRMFRAEGPGMAYGFTMNKRESVPCNWPVGSKLYFSQDGETTGSLILTITAADAGKTVNTDVPDNDPKSPAIKPDKGIAITLRNNRALPRKVSLISYAPGETGNGTSIFMLAPLVGTKSFTFPVGTRLYLANSEQVDVVMSGKRIDSGPPFLTVKKEDAKKVFSIFE